MRSTSSSTRPPTRWSRPSRPASSTTPMASTPSSSTSSRRTRTSRPSRAAPTAGSQLAFNQYGASTGKTIKDGGPSTKALLDPEFRDALGYAVDHQALVDRVLGGYGDVGIDDRAAGPDPVARRPDHAADLRHRDGQAEARRDAGYPLDADRQPARQGRQADQPAACSCRTPTTNYPKAAQFIADWYGQLGIKVTTQVLELGGADDKIICRRRPATRYKADYDIELWGWSGGVDPNGLLQIFQCDEIGTSSRQPVLQPGLRPAVRRSAEGDRTEARKAILDQMQNIIYDNAAYDILYYDAEPRGLSDRQFAGWQNQPRPRRDAALHVQHARATRS